MDKLKTSSAVNPKIRCTEEIEEQRRVILNRLFLVTLHRKQNLVAEINKRQTVKKLLKFFFYLGAVRSITWKVGGNKAGKRNLKFYFS